MIENVCTKNIGGKTIEIIKGDITEVDSDAIVNAANNQLWMGGGVAGAIKRKGGQIIESEAMKQGPIPIGEAVITTAGKLKAKHVIHAAGMGTDLQTDETKIKNATKNSLIRAQEANLRSIAFPAIGTGVGRFPIEIAGKVMIGTAIEFLQNEKDTSIERIIFTLFDDYTFKAFIEVLKNV